MGALHYQKEVRLLGFQKIRSLLKARKEIILDFKIHLNLILFRKQWRERNPHNGTIAVNVFPPETVTIGNATYGGLKVLAFGNPEEKLCIGNYCSIADSVTFLLGGEHGYRTLSTFPLWSHVLGYESSGFTPTKGPIVVEDDVWIGCGALILSGVTIGKGAIVAAGSVVTKDVPPYGIWAGHKVIKQRFSDEIVQQITDADLTKIRSLSFEQQKFICEQTVTAENAIEMAQWLR